jgi:hypothetical protein
MVRDLPGVAARKSDIDTSTGDGKFRLPASSKATEEIIHDRISKT